MKSNKERVYCHFSFKRPKDKAGRGYFAVALYTDSEGKKLMAQRTVERKLWEDHQFITAIQSYEFALSCISEWQGILRSKGVGQVLLVTDNSILAGWIEEPKKNVKYFEYMQRAVKEFKMGAPREIALGIGLCDVVNYEKSYKFCKWEKIRESDRLKSSKEVQSKRLLEVSSNLKTALDIIEEDMAEPEIGTAM